MTIAILIISIVTLISIWYMSSVLRLVFSKISQVLEMVIKEMEEEE